MRYDFLNWILLSVYFAKAKCDDCNLSNESNHIKQRERERTDNDEELIDPYFFLDPFKYLNSLEMEEANFISFMKRTLLIEKWTQNS